MKSHSKEVVKLNETDKTAEVLAFYIESPQCTHIMLICCHNGGYVPVLIPYASQALLAQKLTLVSTGGIHPAMVSLGLRTTDVFEPLFSATGSRQVSTRVSSAILNILPSQRKNEQDLHMFRYLRFETSEARKHPRIWIQQEQQILRRRRQQLRITEKSFPFHAQLGGKLCCELRPTSTRNPEQR